MQRISIRRILPWLIAAVIAGLAVYKLKFAPVPVIAYTVVRGEIVGEVMGTGTLEARVKTTVSPRIQERLLEVLVDQGETVRAGQLLARLDDAESKQQVAIAEATLAAAKQTAERVRADLARSEAVLAQAQLDHQRRANLTGSGAVSRADADKASEALRVAEADLNRSRAAIAEAEVLIRGVSAWVDETAMPALAADQPARIVFRSRAGHGYRGKVSRLGRETDRETREFLVDVHASELPENWTIGQRAEVFIETGRQADAVLLPASFVVWKGGRAGVVVNAGGKARWREITTGMRGKDQLAVIRGLDAGEQVVRVPEGKKASLDDGKRVNPP